MATRKELMARLPSVIAGGKSTDLGTPVISPFSVDKPKTKPTSFTDAVEQSLPDMTAGGPDKTTTRESGGNQRSSMDRQMVAPVAPVAPVAEPVDNNRALALFNNTHGSAFDPKSSMDKKKMAAITSLMSKAGSDKLTPNQFAMQIYRTTK